MKLLRARTIWWPTWQGWLLLIVISVGFLLTIAWNAHRFLAVTSRIAEADVLVVEAWVPEVVVKATAREFVEGRYQLLLVSDFRGSDAREDSKTAKVIQRLGSHGVPRDKIVVTEALPTDEYRSFAMACSVRDALRQGNMVAKGVNIIAPAAHARKTWLAYGRALGPDTGVGTIAVLPGDYGPARWWKTSQGVKWVIANGAGWLHELITGPRS